MFILVLLALSALAGVTEATQVVWSAHGPFDRAAAASVTQPILVAEDVVSVASSLPLALETCASLDCGLSNAERAQLQKRISKALNEHVLNKKGSKRVSIEALSALLRSQRILSSDSTLKPFVASDRVLNSVEKRVAALKLDFSTVDSKKLQSAALATALAVELRTLPNFNVSPSICIFFFLAWSPKLVEQVDLERATDYMLKALDVSLKQKEISRVAVAMKSLATLAQVNASVSKQLKSRSDVLQKLLTGAVSKAAKSLRVDVLDVFQIARVARTVAQVSQPASKVTQLLMRTVRVPGTVAQSHAAVTTLGAFVKEITVAYPVVTGASVGDYHQGTDVSVGTSDATGVEKPNALKLSSSIDGDSVTSVGEHVITVLNDSETLGKFKFFKTLALDDVDFKAAIYSDPSKKRTLQFSEATKRNLAPLQLTIDDAFPGAVAVQLLGKLAELPEEDLQVVVVLTHKASGRKFSFGTMRRGVRFSTKLSSVSRRLTERLPRGEHKYDIDLAVVHPLLAEPVQWRRAAVAKVTTFPAQQDAVEFFSGGIERPTYEAKPMLFHTFPPHEQLGVLHGVIAVVFTVLVAVVPTVALVLFIRKYVALKLQLPRPRVWAVAFAASLTALCLSLVVYWLWMRLLHAIAVVAVLFGVTLFTALELLRGMPQLWHKLPSDEVPYAEDESIDSLDSTIDSTIDSMQGVPPTSTAAFVSNTTSHDADDDSVSARDSVDSELDAVKVPHHSSEPDSLASKPKKRKKKKKKNK
ncbi:MAG: hypothetical protein MHM6MM_000624 [Cercozoa sp. M6MM]